MSVPSPPPGTSIDAADEQLRAARRARVVTAMAEAELDVLVLGRRDDVAYATGLRGLWTAGTRPFGPAALLVAATGAVHVLSTWDDGVPPEIPFEHLFGVTWNPQVMAAALGAVPGLSDARRIGVDAWSPGFARAVGRLAPGADVVAADDVVRAVRARKLPAEVERMAAACGVARAAVDAAATALVTRGELGGPGGAARADLVRARAAALRLLADRGVTVPTTGVVVDPGPDAPGGGHRRVHVDVGVLVDGYEGGAGRTVTVGSSVPPGDGRRAAEALDRVVAACRPGATGASLVAAAVAAGADGVEVRGSGMGVEPPVVTPDVGAGAVLASGAVVSVAVAVAGDRRRDLVLVADDGPPHGLEGGPRF